MKSIVCSLGLVCVLLNAGIACVHNSDMPNIVLILADDLGYGDLGCYGHPYAKTPAIDKLASEGTRFTQFYVTGVTCNPSRTGLMTGLFPARFEKYPADYGFGEHQTITQMLKDHGYKTGHFGKWHIGPDSSPGIYGIDNIPVIKKRQNQSAGRDDALFTAAIAFISKNKGGPFYINVWGHATHFPVNTAPEFVREFQNIVVNRNDFSVNMQHKFEESFQINKNLNESMRQYLGDVLQIDRNADRLLETIDRLNLRKNTIVVFSSDHGPAPVILKSKGVREYSKNMLGYAGEFRGGKHDQLEGGVRVPFIVRWPGKVKPGRIDSESVISFIDWLPTLAKISGITELPEGIDGEDVSDIWQGNSRQRTKPLFWKTSSNKSDPAIRDGKWKLHIKGRRKNEIELELYDLSKDPAESNNLALEHPKIADRLKSKLDAWVDELPSSYQKQKDQRKKKKKRKKG